MKNNCDIIRDLLPLYQDDICSESSRSAVEEHLKECKECSDYLESMRKSGEIESIIEADRSDAISAQAKFFKRKSAVVGTVFAGVFMLPVLICLIVGLATGGISWVMIVLSAMLIPASLIVVPLLVPENKALWTLGSFTVSLMLLFGVCCAVTGGSWFFTAASSTLFGLSVFFAPFAAKAKPVSAILGNHKGLAVMGLDTALYIIMMLCIGLSNGLGAGYYNLAAFISLPILIWAWGLFAIIRYLKAGKLIKTAAALGITAVIMTVSSLIFNLGEHTSLIYIETENNRYEFGTFTALAVVCMIIGAVFTLIGMLRAKKRRNK
ncbi:zf-HC2 domain-containing protein [Ruminococcus sp. NK3A76]|uniref:zf-HC2 domain-containing protein n=1 Tax=Ruminococcus sp. NK3A76 TaxID=877411 RepID=UPI00048DCD7B|nr:zf-HC2 domain-containing protein [Ruminococcus sp. NK3A76]